jgi:hypothetical protein
MRRLKLTTMMMVMMRKMMILVRHWVQVLQVLAPTPPRNDESPKFLSPATQTLNTLSQSHLLNVVDEKNDNTAHTTLTRGKISKPVTVSHCLPWKTRTERKKHEQALQEEQLSTSPAESVPPPIDLGLLTYSEYEETQESLETLPSTERLHELLSNENQEHPILLSSTPSEECKPRKRKADHIILPAAKQLPQPSLPDSNPVRLSSRPGKPDDEALPSLLVTTNVPSVQWTDSQEDKLQLYLQSLPLRMVTFHQPGPLGFTVLPRRLGRHNYCAVGEPNTPLVHQGNSSAFHRTAISSQYEALDVLQSTTQRPLVIGMCQVPTLEDLNAAMNMIASPMATIPPRHLTKTTLHRLETLASTLPLAPDDLFQSTLATCQMNEWSSDILVETPSQPTAVPNRNDNNCPAPFEPTILAKDVKRAIPALTTATSAAGSNRSKKSIRWSETQELSQSEPERSSSRKCSQQNDLNRKRKSNEAQVPCIELKKTNGAVPKPKVSIQDMLKCPALFCNVCQNRNQSTRHHVRCPKSPCFNVERFERMVHGYNQGCEACKSEYRYARTSRQHTACYRGTQVPDLTDEQRQDTPYCNACQTKNWPSPSTLSTSHKFLDFRCCRTTEIDSDWCANWMPKMSR